MLLGADLEAVSKTVLISRVLLYIMVSSVITSTIALISVGCPQDRSTSLHLAAEFGHPSLLEILLKRGANLKAVNNVSLIVCCLLVD